MDLCAGCNFESVVLDQFYGQTAINYDWEQTYIKYYNNKLTWKCYNRKVLAIANYCNCISVMKTSVGSGF